MGTLLYAPPEQYGYSQSSPQTDIYALGIVLIYLATGSPDRRNLPRRITDPQLRSLIEKCIAFDPKARFVNVGQIIKRINGMKTRKFRIAGGVAAGCLALALMGVGIWQAVLAIQASGFVGQTQTPGQTQVNGQTQTPQQNLVDASTLLGEIANADYPSSSDPQIGSTNWLYDYNNDGNLQVNINNGGFAVSADYGNTIYVASGSTIYKLDSEGNILEEVYSGNSSGLHSLSIYSYTLYFSEYNGIIHSINLDTGAESTFNNTINADRIYFDNGRMYYTNRIDALNLYSIKADGTSLALVSAVANAHYTNVVDGFRYYADENDGSRIYAQNLTTGETALVFDSPVIWVSVCNGRIYFEDDMAGRLASIRLDGSDYQVVYDQPCYYINATPRGIFAINAITSQLVVVSPGGGEKVVLDIGEPVQFCVAGGWVFYRNSNEDTLLGMVREDGTDHRDFDPQAR
jgi:hypothetical protein